MPDADSALRAEIEKVRDRARLQALAQGVSTDEADRRGQKAVDDFCGKWGIRPEMVSTPKEPRVPPAPVRCVDLGSSPLRTSSNPSSTQAMRISDLLKRGKDALGAGASHAAPSPAAAHPPPAPAGGGKSNLAGLLDRVRANSLVEVPSVSPTPARAPAVAAPPTAPRPAPPAPAKPAPAPAPARSAPPPARIQPSPAPSHGAPLTAERRKALLEEFDRTYAEVQSMIEERIGVADVAMGDLKGLASAFERVAKGGVSPDEAKVLSSDVERLRDHLRQMMYICDEFLSHLDEFVERRSGSARP